MSDIDSKVIPLLQEILGRLTILEKNAGIESSSGSSAGVPELPKSVRSFDAYCTTNLDPFVAAASKLGGDAKVVGDIIKQAWVEMRKVILTATACKEPPQSQLPTLLGALGAQLKACSNAVKRNEWEKHGKTCSEGIGALNWLLVKPAPCDFIDSYIGGSDYWANNIRKEFRTTNPDQIAFCDTFKALLTELKAYVKENHTTGLTWNPKGVDVSEYNPDSAPTSAPAAAPKPVPAAPAATTTSAPAAKGDLFAALNKEGAVTAGLKKVTKDMQTWRSEYKGGDAPAPAAPKAAAPVKAAAPQVKGPPKLEFQEASNKWIVENQWQDSPITIEIKDKKETVYIYGCFGATIQIKGKCKSIVVDSCKRTNVFFDVAMASCEVVNSQRMNIHVLDTVSSVAIDKTDGIVVHLPLTSLTTEIVASKSSEMNVSWPDENGDLIERPIPEQYVHRIKGKTITADVSDLYGH